MVWMGEEDVSILLGIIFCFLRGRLDKGINMTPSIEPMFQVSLLGVFIRAVARLYL